MKHPGNLEYYKRPNLRKIGIEDLQLKDPENILNKIIEVNFPNLKKETSINIQGAYRTDWTEKKKKKKNSTQSKHRMCRTTKD